MPVKRRLDKSRALDDQMMEDLFYGPGNCLLNGTGYLGDHGDGFWRDKSPEVQSQVLAQMEADWQRWQGQILNRWDARTDHELDIAERYHGAPAQPWAQREFGKEDQ